MTLHAIPEELIEIKRKFVEAMREGGQYEIAAVIAGRSSRQIRRYAEADPDFAEAISDAHAEYWALFRSCVADRLQWGVVQPVYQGGVRVGSIRRYQDATAVGLLMRYDPQIADKPQRIIHERGGEGSEAELDFSRFDSDEEIETFLRLHRKALGKPDPDAEPDPEAAGAPEAPADAVEDEPADESSA